MSGTSVGQAVGAVVGAVVGFYMGGPMGAAQGFAIGYSLGGVVDPPKGPRIEGPRLDDKKVVTSTYGDAIPLVYGPDNRLSGNVIWSTGLIEHAEEEESGGKGGGGGATTVNYTYSISFALALSGRRGTALRRIWMNNKLVYNVANATGPLPTISQVNGQVVTKSLGTHAVFEELHFWPGSTVQVPDPLIESINGAGQVPAYRGITYVVFKDLQLADFGNRLPNIEVELSGDSEIALSQIVHDICQRSGVTDASVTGLNDIIKGYSIGRPSNGAGAITPLALAYHFDVAEQRGQVRFVKRALGMKATIPVEQMGAISSTESPINPITHEKNATVELPREVTVSFADRGLDYQINSQRSSRDQGTTESNESTQFPLTLTADEARRIADRMLWSPWAARSTAKFRVDDRWVRRDPGDVLGIPVAGQVLPYKLLRMTRGDNGVIETEVQRDDPELYNSTAPGVEGVLPENVVQFPGVTRLVLIDTPIMRDTDDDTGFYWAVTAINRGWRGATVFRSSDGGTTYNQMSNVGVRTKIGDVAAALPSGPTDYWDMGNTITVVLAYEGHTLQSLTEEQVLNGNNAFWLGNPNGQGGEIIQFQTATLVGTQTYQLSGLLRGRLGTEANVGLHGTNEVFILLNLNTMGRSDFGPGDWNAQRHYKPVSTLTNLIDAAAQTFTNTGIGKKPLSPVHVRGVRDTSNNLTVTWTRRSRLRSPGLGNGLLPLGEQQELYEVDIFVGANVVRTMVATSDSVGATYTAAQQTSDGITPGNPVTLRVYQMSGTAGRGFPAIATV